MVARLLRLLGKGYIRFPLSVLAAVVIISAVNADNNVIPWWLTATTQQYACSPSCNGGGGGGDGGATPTPAPPAVDAGWSSASWGGPPQTNADGTAQKIPNGDYAFGIVGGDWGSYCMGSTNPHLLQAISNITGLGGHYYGVFWFVVGIDWAQQNCGYAHSAAQWGIDQADHFANVLDTIPSGENAQMAAAFADVEANGVYWNIRVNNYQANIDTIASFMSELCRRNYCSNGVYTSASQWTYIVGNYSGENPQPKFNTTQIWLSNYGPASVSDLNAAQNYFNVSPGGFSIFSWQYAADSCQPSQPSSGGPCSLGGWAYSDDDPGAPISQGYDCHLTFANAKSDAQSASPPIPRFDKWTNTEPESECQPPPISGF